MKTAVVTGAASGIGLAVVRRLLEQGLLVLAVDRDGERLGKVADLGATPLMADVANRGAREAIAREAGTCDHLVNAAGVIEVARLDDVSEAQWARMFAVNAEACFFLTQLLARRMNPGGSIVNVASMAAKTGEVEAAVYAATKAAVLSMTRSFAAGLAPNRIRVNAVCPGIIDTPMQGAFLPTFAQWAGKSEEDLQAERVRDVPLGRIGSPDDVAALVCFLLSDDASYLTGEAVNASGGLVYW